MFFGSESEQRFTRSIGDIERKLTTTEQVGAKAVVSASSGPDGSQGKVDLGALVGGKQTATESVETPFGGFRIGASLLEGAGAGGKIDASGTKNNVGGVVAVFGAAGPGVGVEAGAHVNPAAIAHAASGAASDVGHTVSSAASDVEHAAGHEAARVKNEIERRIREQLPQLP